jgi:hypothetical protein
VYNRIKEAGKPEDAQEMAALWVAHINAVLVGGRAATDTSQVDPVMEEENPAGSPPPVEPQSDTGSAPPAPASSDSPVAAPPAEPVQEGAPHAE